MESFVYYDFRLIPIYIYMYIYTMIKVGGWGFQKVGGMEKVGGWKRWGGCDV